MSDSNWIDALADDEAIDLLERFAAGNRHQADVTEWTPEVHTALAEVAAISDAAAVSSEGELARATLQLLATSDPSIAEALDQLHSGTQAEALGFLLTVGVVTAAIIALQTKVTFEAHEDGTWSVAIDKGALDDALLKVVIAKLFALAGV
ncbi:MAG: hypothetical protein SFV23_14695 [Planctomycetaceae bacterium]|nr:hypothetical protein [Planctomycetaceae bacterium]